MQGTSQLSELEKESSKLYQALLQGENFRSLSQIIIPALNAIGTEKPSLIIESVNLLSTSKYIGNMNILTARSSAMGLQDLVNSVPDVAVYLKNEKIDYLTELLEKRSQIKDTSPHGWRDYCVTLRRTINLLNQENQQIDAIQKERFIPPGAPYSAITHLRKIVQMARTNLKIIDPYADIDTLSLIENCNIGVNIQILSISAQRNRGINGLILEAQKYKAQYGHIEVKLETPPGTQHDRFIIIDDNQIYHIGCSINSIGNKATMIDEVQNQQEKTNIRDNFNSKWNIALQKV